MGPTSGVRLENIQALRAIAAWLVLVMHTFNLAAIYGGKPIIVQIMTVLRPIGLGGVDIFFVVSGFIIVWVAHRASEGLRPCSPTSAKAALGFAIHRLARILPLYWVTLAVMLMLPSIPGSDSDWRRLAAEPGALFLITAPAAHPVAWTLVFEMHFYAVATILVLFAGRRVAMALALWGGVQIAIVIALMSPDLGSSSFFQPVSIDFVLGVALAASVILSPNRKAPLVVWGVASTIVAGVFLWRGKVEYDDSLARVLMWGVPTMAVLYGLIVLETSRGMVFPSWLRRCGDWSYSLYLWHVPVLIAIGITAKALGRTGTFAGGAGYVVLGLALSLVVSVLSFRYLESPVLRWMHRKRPSAVRAIRTATPAG